MFYTRTKRIFCLVLILTIFICNYCFFATDKVSANNFLLSAGVTDGHINLNWASVPGASIYKVYEINDQEQPILLKVIDINEGPGYLSYTAGEYDPSTRHTFRVEAYASLSDQNPLMISNTLSATTLNLLSPSPLGSVFNINNIGPAGDRRHLVTLTWKNNTTTTGYSVVITRSGWAQGFSIELSPEQLQSVTQNGISTYSFEDTFSTYGSSVYYYITAKKVKSDSTVAVSQPSSGIMVVPAAAPSISASFVNGSVQLTWPYFPYISDFELQRSRFSGGAWTNWEAISSLSYYTHTGAAEVQKQPGIYRYRLVGKNKYSGSSISGSVNVFAAPDKLSASILSNNHIRLGWENPQGNECQLRIERRRQGESYTAVQTLNSSVSAYDDHFSFSAGASYFYRIVAFEGQNSLASSEIRIDFSVPAATSQLEVSGNYTSGVTLKWRDNSNNEDGFKIERRIGQGVFQEIDVDSQQLVYENGFVYYKDMNIEDGKSYVYRVRAFNVLGNSAYSNEAKINVENVPVPGNLQIAALSDNSASLSWNIPMPQLATIIERKKGIDGQWQQIHKTAFGATSYIDAGLAPDTRYYYRIRCVNNSNVISEYYPSEEQPASVLTMMQAPLLYTNASSDNSIMLYWTGNIQGHEFIIERKIPGGDFVQLSIVNGTNMYIDSFVMPNATYVYRIKSRNISNVSVYSQELTVSNSYLEPPYNLFAQYDGSAVNLKWSEKTFTETGFEIWRAVSGSQDWKLIRILGPNYISYTDEDIARGVKYDYRIRAVDVKNNVFSPFSNIASVSVVASTPVPYAKVVSSSQVYLSWSDFGGNKTGYRIERKIYESDEWASIASVSSTTLNCTDSGLSNANPYYYRIVAFNLNDMTEIASMHVKVWLALPNTPWSVSAQSVSSLRNVIEWNNDDTADSLVVLRRKHGEANFVQVAKVGTDKKKFLDSGLIPGTIYYYKIQAINTAGAAETSVFQLKTKNKASYTDVAASRYPWAITAIEDLGSRGVFDAASGRFRPADRVTRGEFAAMLVRALKLDMTPIGTFKDVKPGHKFYREIMTAKQFGIVTGDNQGYFRPERPITRQDAAVVINNALKAVKKPLQSDDPDILERFVDKHLIQAYAVFPVTAVVKEGLMNGKSALLFGPGDFTTRAEAAVIVYRIVDR